MNISSKRAQSVLNDSSRPLPVQVNKNVKVENVEVGDNYIDFTYADDKGRSVRNRIFFPNPDNPMTRNDETEDQAKDREIDEFVAQLVHHMHIFLKPNETEVEAPTVPAYAKIVADKLRPVLHTKRVNVKPIYDRDGKYLRFGKYPDQYIEEYIEGEEPTLGFSSWELKNNRHLSAAQRIQDSDDAVVGSDIDDLV